ncbi:hypothetical protein GCM10020216_011030 [Nonomuraea helvata]
MHPATLRTQTAFCGPPALVCIALSRLCSLAAYALATGGSGAVLGTNGSRGPRFNPERREVWLRTVTVKGRTPKVKLIGKKMPNPVR